MTKPKAPHLMFALYAAWSFVAAGGAFADSSAGAESTLSREQWHGRLRWETAECPLRSPDPASAAVKVRAFGSDSALLEVECERWAYQGTRMIYLRKGTNATPLTFEQFEAPDVGRLERYSSRLVTGDVSVNAAQQSIDVLRKYRGLGDCGQYLRYQIRDAKAVLAQMRVRECSDRPSKKNANPDKWPLRK